MTKLIVAFRDFANAPIKGEKIIGMHYKSSCHVLIKPHVIAFAASSEACLLDPQVAENLSVILFGSPLYMSPYRVPEIRLRSSHGRNNTKVSQEALNVGDISTDGTLCYLVPISHVLTITP